MAESDVLKGELSSRFETGNDREDDDFEHPNMLTSSRRNRNDTNPDGIFGRHRGVCFSS
jgi:hypothetical protein